MAQANLEASRLSWRFATAKISPGFADADQVAAMVP